MRNQSKILEIGNYPPPLCGWAMETKLVVDQLRQRGCTCEVLKINENRKVKSPEYTDVQNGFDYLRKVVRFARRGYRFHVHVNGESKKGYLLAWLAVAVAQLGRTPVFLTFHGGLPQTFFPHPHPSLARWAFKILFHLASGIRCNSKEIKRAIEDYGIQPRRVVAIPAFSPQYVDFVPSALEPEVEVLLARHHPLFFCYVSFRPEYRLNTLREAMKRFRQDCPQAGFIWLGFPAKELPGVMQFVRDWAPDELESLLVLGNLSHDKFLTLLRRSSACIRTPACDGVSASVLEALAMGVPVVASENGRRPEGVITYPEHDAAELYNKLKYVIQQHNPSNRVPTLLASQDNVGLIADWVLSWPSP